ncbi:hypothetical protein QUB56_15950 [Microcoleus sp. AR_TQ3_B6]
MSVLKTCDRESPSEIFLILQFSLCAAVTEKVPQFVDRLKACCVDR